MLPIARLLGSASAGLLLVLSFAPFDLWWTAPLSVAALALLVRGRRWQAAGWMGLLYGLGFFVPLLHWTPVQTGPVPWLALSLAEALFMSLMGIALMLVQRLPLAPLWIAAVWVGQEALRGRIPWGGLTWGKLGFGQAEGPLLPLAAWGGSVGLTFVVALIGGLLAVALLPPLGAGRTSPWRRITPIAAAVALILLPVAVPSAVADGRTVSVAVVQGNVPQAGLDFNARAHVITQNHSDATVALAADVAAGRAEQPDLVIWPENASDRNPLPGTPGVHDTSTDLIERAAEAIGVPIHVGAVVPTPDERNVMNMSIVWDPESGPGQTYVKRHPMPFGEYIPMRSLARLITDAVDLQPRDFVPGQEVGVLDIAGVRMATAICFEVAFDNLVRDAVRAGGEAIMVPTNNATFGFAPMSEQQLAMSRLRAVEHGRPVIHAGLAGISAIVAPDGTISHQTDLYTQDVISTDITTSTIQTPATRLGEIPEFALSAAALVVAVAGILGHRRRSRTGGGAVKAAVENAPRVPA